MARNQVLGSGKVYVDRFDDDGNPTGEFYVGNTTSLTVSQDEDVLEHQDSDNGLKETDIEVPTSQTMTVGFTLDDIQPENVATYFKGAEVINTVIASEAITETIKVLQNRYYQLGVSDAHPSGLRGLSGLVVKVGAVAVAETDYTFDGDLGRVFISPDAVGIDDNDEVIFTYDQAAATWSTIISTGDNVEGAIRFVSKNGYGPDRDHYWPRARLTPDGDYELKGDDWQEMTFSGAVLKKGNLARHYTDGRAVTA